MNVRRRRGACTSRTDAQLALGRTGIMTVGVTGADLTVLAVDETLGMLIPGNLPCDGSGLLLGAGASGCSGVTGTLDLPATLGVGGNMLISSCH